MDPNTLKNLGLSSGMNKKDIDTLTQLLGTAGNKGKKPKMSAQDRNNLINNLTSATTLNNLSQTELSQKEFKNMTDDKKCQRRTERIFHTHTHESVCFRLI